MSVHEKHSIAVKKLPMVISRELVVFPGSVIPFFTSDDQDSRALKQAFEEDKLVFFSFLHDGSAEDKSHRASDRSKVYRIGTVVKVLQIFKTSNGMVRILGEGKYRGIIREIYEDGDINRVLIDPYPVPPSAAASSDEQALITAVKKYFRDYARELGRPPADTVSSAEKEDDPDKLVDLIAGSAQLDAHRKIKLLQIFNTRERLQELAVMLQTEHELLKLNGDIQKRVQKKLEQTQKEYFLNEQIRQINKELGRDEEEADEPDLLFNRIKEKNPPEEVVEKARKEAGRLRKLQPMAPESGVLRTYLEWLADLPWDNYSKDSFDLPKAEQILDEDHYNMKRPKERILDYMAVRRLQPRLKGPILCFVGPPGTGKTSLGRSVARALGKDFIRISLGGIRDEAEIRGHRKTYVGALPGKIIQSIRKAGTSNPVFLLDEVDKLSSDFRGDPSSALLEVLDPEQNSTFTDHYLEVPYDLSQVLFIATANSLHTVPAALRDRMEIIEIPGYSDIEKYNIAQQFLIPKQIRENGLEQAAITFQKSAVYTIISDYTMESGVRNLERCISQAVRKIAREYLNQSNPPALEEYRRSVSSKTASSFLGKPEYAEDQIQRASECPGIAHGLAWTEAGGKLLTVEAALMPGEKNLILTGSLGEVMKESARISYSFLQANHAAYGIDPRRFAESSVHIHVPQGAIPKDGPSAGITILAAMASAFSGRPLKSPIAMTGEITLSGQVLRIGGIKEKLLAAYRHGINRVMMPEGNKRDLDDDIPKSVLQKMEIIHVTTASDALGELLPQTETPQG